MARADAGALQAPIASSARPLRSVSEADASIIELSSLDGAGAGDVRAEGGACGEAPVHMTAEDLAQLPLGDQGDACILDGNDLVASPLPSAVSGGWARAGGRSGGRTGGEGGGKEGGKCREMAVLLLAIAGATSSAQLSQVDTLRILTGAESPVETNGRCASRSRPARGWVPCRRWRCTMVARIHPMPAPAVPRTHLSAYGDRMLQTRSAGARVELKGGAESQGSAGVG